MLREGKSTTTVQAKWFLLGIYWLKKVLFTVCVSLVYPCVGDVRLVIAAGHGLYRRAHRYLSGGAPGCWHGSTDAAGSTLPHLERCAAHYHLHSYTGIECSCMGIGSDLQAGGLDVCALRNTYRLLSQTG